MGNSINNYISNLYNFYKSTTQKNQSLTDILTNFSQISKDYKDIIKEKNIANNQYHYSSYNFVECTNEEQLDFINNQLQLIESLVTNSIYEKNGMIWNWYDIFNLITNTEYANTEKIKRKVVYSTTNVNRPIGDVSYNLWNGLQIIDLDIKNAELATNLKPLLFDNLKKYSWFLGICKSASKKSLHIWTKITPFTIENDHRRIEYLANFRHKYSYIYIVLLQLMDKFSYTKDDIIQYMDMAMCKPQQGIFISSDNEAMMNTNFIDLRLDVNFESACNNGIESINWISHPDLKERFRQLEWFSNDKVENEVQISNISELENRDVSKNKRIHYKHNQRWQLANTLAALYGEEKGLKIMVEICKDTPYQELKGDIHTAVIHNKPISEWAVKTLNRSHGFNIKIKENNEEYSKEIEKINEKISENDSVDPTKILNDNTDRITLHLKSTQYLSDIKEDIVKNLGKITLLEAGAGYGKTEMIKSLKDKTLLILPFTSTIKAKVEASEVTKDWLYYYGNKRPTLDEILGHQNMSMTVDKFSRLNVMELDQADFKYIVIDESHLLFTSSYRDVMSPTIQRLANCNAKIIMMTGTPTGELLFFPGIKHIKVIKEDNRIKKFEIHLCHAKTEKLIQMCHSMGDDIIAGKKILYPSNKGNLHYEQIRGIIQEYLIEKGYNKPIRSFYYKKANYGEETMEEINVDKSIGNNDLIMCTNYLSVGVDICDKYNFSVYFSELWIPQDVEQFANRLRNNDLYLKMFLEKYDSSGYKINYNDTKPLNLNFNMVEMLVMRDFLRVVNDMIERNDEESKYNPMIYSLLTANKSLKYDENDCKFYIDETTYKLKIFEERYSEYSKQMNVLLNGLKYYGYTTNIIDHQEVISEEDITAVEELLKQYRHSHFNEQTVKTFKFLHHINDSNIDIYKEILKGSYSIFKDEEYKEVREENNIYAEDIEIVMKNLPIYLGLYKFYDPETIIEIFEYCKEKKSNKINYTMLNRIRRFITIEDNRRRKRLDFPVYKFILDAQTWAKDNPYVSKADIDEWIGKYSAKLANVVKNAIVDDVQFLETIYDLTEELFDIIVIKKRPKNGIIHIEPFELLWTKKIDITDVYGGSINTKEFFLQDLVENMKSMEELEDERIKSMELPHTDKLKLEDVKEQIEKVISKPFAYYEYSEIDGSNDRFLRKQKNTNHLADQIFDNLENILPEKQSKIIKEEMNDLFENQKV